MELKKNLLLAFVFALLLHPAESMAGVTEISTSFSFNRTKYSEDSFTWNRRYSASVAYHFTQSSGVELAYQDSVTRTLIQGVQDTEFHDRIYSLNWIQFLLEKKYIFQPYFKLGVGQLNRDSKGSYSNGEIPPPRLDSVTVVIALGSKLFLTRSLAINVEVTSYLSGGSLRTWKDNGAVLLGASFFF